MIICHIWGDLATIFTSDKVTSENHSHIISRETKNRYSCQPTHYLISYMLFSVLNTQMFWKQWSLIFPLSPRMVFSGLTLWCHLSWSVTSCKHGGTGIVMSYLLIDLDHANWCKADLHYWTTVVNIDFLPAGFHGLSCKKEVPLYMRLSSNHQVSFISPEELCKQANNT